MSVSGRQLQLSESNMEVLQKDRLHSEGGTYNITTYFISETQVVGIISVCLCVNDADNRISTNVATKHSPPDLHIFWSLWKTLGLSSLLSSTNKDTKEHKHSMNLSTREKEHPTTSDTIRPNMQYILNKEEWAEANRLNLSHRGNWKGPLLRYNHSERLDHYRFKP